MPGRSREQTGAVLGAVSWLGWLVWFIWIRLEVERSAKGRGNLKAYVGPVCTTGPTCFRVFAPAPR
jgi:hypothetical protein